MKFKEDIEKELFLTYGSYCTCGWKNDGIAYYCKMCNKPLVRESLDAEKWNKSQLLKVIRAVIEDTVEDYDVGYNVYRKIHIIINNSVHACDATKYSNRLFNGEKVI